MGGINSLRGLNKMCVDYQHHMTVADFKISQEFH